MHRTKFRAAASAALLSALLATSACSSDGKDSSAESKPVETTTTTTEPEFMDVTGDDAAGDIIEIRIAEDFVGHRVEVEYVNNGADRADYHFQVRVVDAEGNTVEPLETVGYALDPGQTSVAYASMFEELPEGATIELVGAYRNPAEPPGENGIALGFATEDASADIVSMNLVRENGSSTVYLSITNNGTVKSDYHIGVALESPDGTVRHDTLFAFLNEVDPAQTAETSSFTTIDIPEDAVMRLFKVQRTESW